MKTIRHTVRRLEERARVMQLAAEARRYRRAGYTWARIGMEMGGYSAATVIRWCSAEGKRLAAGESALGE